jgi:hypothetical protein
LKNNNATTAAATTNSTTTTIITTTEGANPFAGGGEGGLPQGVGVGNKFNPFVGSHLVPGTNEYLHFYKQQKFKPFTHIQESVFTNGVTLAICDFSTNS